MYNICNLIMIFFTTEFSIVASSIPNSSSPTTNKTGDRVRTLYACVGEHESELSFEPNQLITGGKIYYKESKVRIRLDWIFLLCPNLPLSLLINIFL